MTHIMAGRAAMLGPEIGILVAEAEVDGHRFMQRLRDEWVSGANRFDRPGETLLAAYRDGRLAGIGGLNIDPYTQIAGVGRLRHLYVAKGARRRGVGAMLVRQILMAAEPHFSVVRLRTDSTDAAAFYTRLGFGHAEEDDATHAIRIG